MTSRCEAGFTAATNELKPSEGTLPTGYQSLFDSLDFERKPDLTYNGTLSGAIGELRRGLQSTSFTQDNLLTRVLYPPRIIRAVIDDKIKHPITASPELIRQAVQVGLAVYSQSEEAESKLEDFESFLSATGKDYILGLPLRQVHDMTTWAAMNPQDAKKTSSLLTEYTGGRPVLFIPLAHGAVGVGMDIFLRYCDEVGDDGTSIYYPARNSHHKEHDRGPKLSEEERQFLHDAEPGRIVVIFDHSVNTGHTLEYTVNFFRSNVFDSEPVTLTNNNQWKEPEIQVKIADLSMYPDL